MNENSAFTPPKERFIYRIRFTKGEEVKFIGHLDIMRVFQRALRRAKLPIAYSQGFNPHQLLSFAHPLSLGITSIGEYGDFEMKFYIEPIEIINGLNCVLPKGIKVLDIIRLSSSAKNAMASTAAAKYEAFIDTSLDFEAVKIKLAEFMKQDEIKAFKKTKNSFKEENIRQDIIKLECDAEDEKIKLIMFISAGSKRNLKAELVVSSFYDFMKIPFDKYTIKYKRIELYRFEKEKYISLGKEAE